MKSRKPGSHVKLKKRIYGLPDWGEIEKADYVIEGEQSYWVIMYLAPHMPRQYYWFLESEFDTSSNVPD